MKPIQSLASAVLTLAMAAAVAAGAWWLVTNKPVPTKSEKSAPAATVTKVVKEADLNTVTLTEDAEKRLGLTLAPVELQKLPRVRVYGGEVTIPVGRTILVAAPVGGTLNAPASGVPSAGQTVKAGQQAFLLLPLLTPDGRALMTASLADADGLVNNTKTQVELARIALERAKRVLKDGGGSQRTVDEAQASFDLATKTLDAGIARQTILSKVVGDVEGGTATPIRIDVPQDGLLRSVSALTGQTVPSGAALFEVVDLSTLWVRVPLPVGDLDDIDRTAAAQLGKLSALSTLPSKPFVSAMPVAAPPSANALASTIDVYYEMPNSGGLWTPGQRIGVTIARTDAQESLTVPWSAIVFDVHGGTWVYEQVSPRTYVRRRVVVRYTSGTNAVLGSGPTVGTKVVAEGVQELFGAETGFIK